MEFEKQYATDEQCREYLFKLRYPKGFKCHGCGEGKVWRTGRGKYQCQKCGKDNSILASTIFQDTHTPLTVWFRAIWFIVAQKHGTNALNLQRILGLGSYQTAWTMLHKLRRAMVRPSREKLQGRVEIDETYIGGPSKIGKYGRGSEGKALIVIAVEVNDNQIGRIRLKLADSASAEDLLHFIEEAIERGSTVISDGWYPYSKLKSMGYNHEVVRNEDGKTENLLPRVHTIASLVKRWILGTFQGSCSMVQNQLEIDRDLLYLLSI